MHVHGVLYVYVTNKDMSLLTEERLYAKPTLIMNQHRLAGSNTTLHPLSLHLPAIPVPLTPSESLHTIATPRRSHRTVSLHQNQLYTGVHTGDAKG